LTPIAPYKSQTARWKRGIIPPIARAHIEKAASGDMVAIKELADRLDGRPAQCSSTAAPTASDAAGGGERHSSRAVK